LLRAIPTDAATVDLALLDTSGKLMDEIPGHVRILPPRPAFVTLLGPMSRAFRSRHFPIGLARLIARLFRTVRGLIGLPRGFLLARSFRYALPFLPRIEGQYDLAISFMMPHDIVAAKVSARRKVGWIHTDYTSVESGVAPCEMKAWSEMDVIVAVSPEVGAAFGKVFPALAHKMKVIENILDPAWVRSRANEGLPVAKGISMDPATARLCSVGRLSHAKGFDIAAKAAALLKSRGVKFRWHIVGYGPDESMLRKLIRELAIDDVFLLLGPRENPYPEIAACDLYVQPSRYEGKSVSIREAQMLGRPVIVSEYPTVRSQVEHDVDGHIAQAGADGLADAIQSLIADPASRHRLASSASSRDYGNLSEVAKVLALLPPDPA
jgi:glycosyltransferase involved in cell wall biosynthesis